MSSLEIKLKKLEKVILEGPHRISVYDDMPYAIFLYCPEDEWNLRREIEGLIIRLSHEGKKVTKISFESLMWNLFEQVDSVDPGEGLPALIEAERTMGFSYTEETIQKYLSGEVFGKEGISIINSIQKHAAKLDPKKDVIFLVHTGAFAPHFFQVSSMVEQMQGKKIEVPIIFFYPGTKEGTIGLRFMDLRDREPTGNYRVSIYGDEV
ncbi:MAG: BREX protein BrxB domain-containing protein [Methanoregula sp.]|jgi:hypothetical protein